MNSLDNQLLWKQQQNKCRTLITGWKYCTQSVVWIIVSIKFSASYAFNSLDNQYWLLEYVHNQNKINDKR